MDEKEIEVRKQDREVSAAEWLPLDEFYEKSSIFNTTFLDHYLAHKQLISPRKYKQSCSGVQEDFEITGLFHDSNTKLF